jgi:hypothetical protein
MERIHRAYKSDAEFFIVYIREAHPCGSELELSQQNRRGIPAHASFADRCRAADRLAAGARLTVPRLADGMEDLVDTLYRAWPDRVYLIRADGLVGVRSDPGPDGFGPGLKSVERWLAAYRISGDDPALPAGMRQRPRYRNLADAVSVALRDGRYREGLESADRLNRRVPDAPEPALAIARLHARLGDRASALTWLELAIARGMSFDVGAALAEYEGSGGDERFAAFLDEVASKPR